MSSHSTSCGQAVLIHLTPPKYCPDPDAITVTLQLLYFHYLACYILPQGIELLLLCGLVCYCGVPLSMKKKLLQVSGAHKKVLRAHVKIFFKLSLYMSFRGSVKSVICRACLLGLTVVFYINTLFLG